MAQTLEILDQPRLPFRKQLEICADGVRHRLFRSLITLSVIALAIAFLMNTLVESTIAGATKRGIEDLGARRRALSDFLAAFQSPVDGRALMARLESAAPGSWQAGTLREWLGFDQPAFDSLRDRSLAAGAYLRWLDSLRIAERRVLVGNRTASDALRSLADAEPRQRFASAAAQFPGARPPTGITEFAPRYVALNRELDSRAHLVNDRIAAVRADVPDIRAALQQATTNEGFDGLLAKLKQHGVSLERRELFDIALEMDRQAGDAGILASMERSNIREAWRKHWGDSPEPDAMLRQLAASEEKASWFHHITSNYWVTDISYRLIYQSILDSRDAAAAEERLSIEYGNQPGIGSRTFWLMFVSLVVCAVGITNAMLIGVLERFREIATMKCLGAMEGLIAMIFMLEAAFLGLAGHALGVLAGLAIGITRMLAAYGRWSWRFMPWRELGTASVASLSAGLLLAMLAAIYPALRASRMPPMEAMRVE